MSNEQLREFSEWLDTYRDLPVHEVFHEIVLRYEEALAAPSQPAVPSVLKRGYGRLIQAAADLALQQFMPSDIVDDYPSKTISAAKVAKMMTQPRNRLRLLSIEVSEGAKQMIAAAPDATSQPVTLTNEFIKEAAGQPEGYKFAAKGISKIDVWPHGGTWFPLYSLTQVQAIIAAMREKERV